MVRRTIAITLLLVAGLAFSQDYNHITPEEYGGYAIDMLNGINRIRAANGVHPLQYDPYLTEMANWHLNLMLEAGVLTHDPPGITLEMKDQFYLEYYYSRTGRYLYIWGENCSYGWTYEDLVSRYYDSRPHMLNLMDRDYEWVGIAIGIDSYGALWTTEVFGRYQ